MIPHVQIMAILMPEEDEDKNNLCRNGDKQMATWTEAESSQEKRKSIINKTPSVELRKV
jgi:hypothetical protein